MSGQQRTSVAHLRAAVGILEPAGIAERCCSLPRAAAARLSTWHKPNVVGRYLIPNRGSVHENMAPKKLLYLRIQFDTPENALLVDDGSAGARSHQISR